MASCACDGITFRMVSFCNLIGSSKFEAVMVDRKCTEALPGPFPDFSGGAWGRGYEITVLVGLRTDAATTGSATVNSHILRMDTVFNSK